jgi:hypothetical protein
MIFNELAQWAMLCFLCIFVLGLTRQLGHFIIPRREELVEEGPPLNRAIPRTLVYDDERHLLESVFASTLGRFGFCAAVSQSCPGCHALLRNMERNRDEVTRRGLFALAAWADGDEEFRASVADVFPVVFEDVGGHRSRPGGIVGVPYVMVVDGELRVRDRSVEADVLRLSEKWSGEAAPVAHQVAAQKGSEANGT